MRQVFEAHDEESAHAVIVAHYTAMTTLAEPQQFRLRLEVESLGRARLDRMEYSRTVQSDLDPLGALCITVVRAGRWTYRQGDTELACGPGDVASTGDPDRPFGVTLADVSADFVMLEPTLLDDVASTEDGRPVALLSRTPTSPGAAQSYREVIEGLRGAHTSEFDSADAPLVTAAAARLLAVTTLAAFPNNARFDPTATDRRDARPRAVRRAIAYIENGPSQDMTIVDIAAAAGVTPRAIQLAFRRHIDMTPTDYIRLVRLSHARDELRAADPADTTVAAIAHRWGFGNASRFAARYRQTFGELPSQTLHR